MKTSEKTDKFLYKFMFIWFCILGILQLQIIEHEYKRTRKFLDLNRYAGQKSVRNEACRFGYGRYEGTNFIWNTNIFNTVDVAMDSVIRSEQKAEKLFQISMRMAQVAVDSGEFVLKLRKDESNDSEENDDKSN